MATQIQIHKDQRQEDFVENVIGKKKKTADDYFQNKRKVQYRAKGMHKQ